jgi:putative ABC transport system permease protein
MKNLWHDIRYALRQLRSSPGFAFTAVFTLALGIAACSTIFSWIDSTLLDPVPGVAHTGAMITIQRGERSEHPSPPFSYPDYVDLRNGTTTLSGLLAYHDDYMTLTGAEKPERIYGALTSGNYFQVLGVKPILGRLQPSSAANERAGAADVVIGYDLWQHRFAGDPAIVGKTMQINLHTYTIIGVAPRGFEGCKTGLRTQLWLPLGMDRQVWGSTRIDDRGLSWLNVLGVLRPGVTQGQAQNELNLLMQRIVQRYPASHGGDNKLSLDPLWRSPFGANVYLSGTLTILFALAGVLLLLACANVADLLLVRSVSRRREFAIRLSMGASRWKLVRQLMVENLMLALAAGAAAIAITFWSARLLGSFLPTTTLPLDINGHVNSTVLLVTFLAAAFTAVASGVGPALRASALSPVSVLKDEALSTSGGLGKSHLASGLAAAQIALSLILLTCAGLFVRSLINAEKTDPGFDPNHVYLASYDLDPMGYSASRATELTRQVLARVQALPGVQSATLADFSPLSFTIHSDGVMPEGYLPRLHESVEADRGIVGPNYLQTLRTPLLAGRDFTEGDSASTQPVAIVNEAFVDRYWPGQNAIGNRVHIWGRWYSVVGVAANAKYRRLVYDPAPLVLLPLMQAYTSPVILQVRVNGDPAAFDPSIEDAIYSLNPNLPLFNVTTLRHSMQLGSVFERIAVDFAGAFGLLAMLLAAVGVYGVVAYTTRQRTHEIGIRLALGAGKGDIFRQVLQQGLRLALVGLAAGLTASFLLTRYLRGLLYGVGAADWLTFTTVAILLCVVALLACFVPAHRAAAIEPADALRIE